MRIDATSPVAVHRRGAAAGRDARRSRVHDDGRRRRLARRGRAPGDAGRRSPTSPPATPRSSSSPRARPASRGRCCTPTGYLYGQRTQAEHWLGAARRRPRLGHHLDRLVEVGPQRLPRAVADGRRGADQRRALRPRRAARGLRPRGRRRSSARRRPSTGCSPRGPSCARCPALRRAVSAGEALGADVLEAYRAGLGHRRLRRLRPDRDRPDHRQRRRRPTRGPDRWARSLPGIETRIVEGELQVLASSCPTFFAGYLPGRRGARADRRRLVGDRRLRQRATTTATSSTRAAATT